MAERPTVREIWHGKDKARRFYAVERASSEDADDHEAIVVHDGDLIRCYRCGTEESIVFHCQHLEVVRDTIR